MMVKYFLSFFLSFFFFFAAAKLSSSESSLVGSLFTNEAQEKKKKSLAHEVMYTSATPVGLAYGVTHRLLDTKWRRSWPRFYDCQTSIVDKRDHGST